MKSPIGGTSCESLSMRTSGQKKNKRHALEWKLYRDQAGQIKFRALKQKVIAKVSGPIAINATLPRRVVDNQENLRKFIDMVRREGGSILSAKGRLVEVEVDADSIDRLGDTLESFGCQWDKQ